MIVICDMLGVPEEDRAQFLGSFRISGRALEPIPLSAQELEEANASTIATRTYFLSLFERRAKQPGDDLISALLAVRDENDGRLSQDELTSEHQSVVRGRARDNRQSHRQRPARAASPARSMGEADARSRARGKRDRGIVALQFLRAAHRAQSRRRYTRSATRRCSIKRGDGVICLLGAGNRDPARYDDPERLDITRENVRPLSFGGGIHHCLGAQLARLEGEIVFRALAERLPKLRLDNIDNPQWRPTLTLRRLASLPASW